MNLEIYLTSIKKLFLFIILGSFFTNEAKSSISCAEPVTKPCGACDAKIMIIYNSCMRSEQAASLAAANIASGVVPSAPIESIDKLLGSEVGTAAGGASATDCFNATNAANACITQDPTFPVMMKQPCLAEIQTLAKQCQAKQASAVDALAKLNQTKEAFGSLLSKAAPYAGVGLLAGGLGYLAGKGGKKGGGGDNNPEVKKDEEDNKLKTLVMDSSSSSSSGPNIVYFDKGTPNNNGSLGNPAVTSSETTSNPSDTVTVAAITPSSSFGSGQNSSFTGSDPALLSRTLSGSTGNASLGGASGDSMDGSGPEDANSEKSANSNLVDGSSKGSGGSAAFMGGMDGSGSGNGQGNSADGTMLTGVLSGTGKNSKKKAPLNKSKNQPATLSVQQKKAPTSVGLKRQVANSTRQAPQQVKSESLVEFMTRKNLIRTSPKELQK